MDGTTHTHMEQLLLRASTKGSHGQRHSFYTNDGTNDPPLSPTAKWKHEAHSYEDSSKDPSKFPYLPHPYPLKRRGRAQAGHPGGFTSLQEPLQPSKFPDEEQIYSTYAEWWQAQRPPDGPLKDKEKTFSTSFWPYGRRISCVASMDDAQQYYHLDKRLVKNHAQYKNRRDPLSSTTMSRSRSSVDQLMGSQTEHFGYNRSLGQTMSSHAGASFHERNKLLASNPAAAASGSRNMWDSMKAQASAPALPAGLQAGAPPGIPQRAISAPSTSRSDQAPAGNSRYDPKQSLRNLGLGTRTHAEWCLPQPPAHAPH